MLQTIESVNTAINNFIWGVPAMICIIGVGLYLSIRLRFIQFRKFGLAMKQTIGKVFEKKEAKDGAMTPFQVVCTALSATVGTGNIAGVAGAICLGGPGAIFWMWIIALIGSASSFVESTLAQIYKVKDGDSFRGGPAYYIEKGLNKRWLGIIFSVLITISFGFVFNAVQANTVATAFNSAFGIDKTIIGLVLAVLTYSSHS